MFFLLAWLIAYIFMVITFINGFDRPENTGSVVGLFTADNVRKRVVNLSGTTADGLDKYIVKKYYKVDLGHKPTLGLVSRMLDISPYVVVVQSDVSTNVQRPLGFVASEDLLMCISTEKKYMNGN